MRVKPIGSLGTPLGNSSTIGLHFGPEQTEIACLSGIHGDELNGIASLFQLRERLIRMEQKGALRKGVLLIMAANPLAIDLGRRNFPFEEIDLHAAFSQSTDQPRTLQEKMTSPLLKATRDCGYLVDVHSSNTAVLESPQVRYYLSDDSRRNDQKRELASATGLKVIWEKDQRGPSIEREAATPIGDSLVHVHPGAGVFIQAGSAGSMNISYIHEVTDALLRILEHCGAVHSGRDAFPQDGEPPWIIARRDGNCSMVAIQYDSQSPCLDWAGDARSIEAGMFVPVEGARVSDVLGGRTGEPIGQVFAISTGERIADVVKPHDGLAFLMSLRVGGIVYPGSLIARLLFHK